MLVQSIFEGLVIGSIFALISMGIALIWGVMNILSFSQGEFLMMGMYITYFINQFFGISPIIAIPFVMVVMYFFGVLIYKTLIRRALNGPILSQRLITFALGMVLVNGMLMLFTSQFRTIPNIQPMGAIDLGFVVISIEKLIPVGVAVVLSSILFLFMNHTRYGKAIRATSMNKDAAELMGIDTEKAYSVAFGISSALAGAAGTALTYYYYITPTVGAPFLLFGFIAVALGGFGSISGALVGGLIMGLVDVLFGVYFNAAFKYVAVSVMFILIVSFKPKGLFGK